MATTTNFGWETPDDTDLVKDGALAMRTLGNAIDTSLVDLKGGTTGQVLSKTSNTDMDFTWVTSDDANAIQNAIVDAKGDLITATAADTPARLASSGVNGDVLQVDTTTATGLKWAAPASTSPLTTKGDLYTYSTTNTRLGVGTDNYFLQAASGQATGLQWGGGFTSYTPTYQNFTLGNGTTDAKYLRIGKTVFVYIKITLGSTSSVTGTWDFTLPVNSAHSSWLAPCYIQDAGTATYVGWLNCDSVRMALYVGNTSGSYLSYSSSSSTVPMTWASGDFIQAYFTYEAA